MGDPLALDELFSAVRDAQTALLWSIDESSPDAIRGHAYLRVDNDEATLLRLVHGDDRTAAMVELLHRFQATKGRTIRDRFFWKPAPESRWTFNMDAGAVLQALRGRRLAHRSLLGDEGAGLFDGAFPEDYLRSPVASHARRLLGDVHWPEELEGQAVCGRFVAARAGARMVLCGCRYGSIHVAGGQDRTAAVFLSNDAGRTWDELGWDLVAEQRDTNDARNCWPPEQIDRVQLDDTLCIEWEDPWIDWEPGAEWRGIWQADARVWRMEERGGW